MYRMYVDKCEEDGVVAVSSGLYRKTFNEEFNLSFHHPKKDLCLLCSNYNDAKRSSTLTTELTEQYEQHIVRKIEARQEKERDKILAGEDSTVETFTFDMEAVLPCPCNQISQTHYKRKLAVYNLSIYSLASREGKCFVWD